MRTSELAGRAGVNRETLRYHERRGVGSAASHAGRLSRLSDDGGRPAAVHQARQGLGFTLDEVEELLHLNEGGPDSCETARALANARRADLEARIADLQRMRDSLIELVATCDLPRGDRSCPLLKTISNNPTDHQPMPSSGR